MPSKQHAPTDQAAPISTDDLREPLDAATPGPWELYAHLRLPNENGCTCGYRGVVYGRGDYAICQPGHDVTPGEECLDPARLPRDEEIANMRLVAIVPQLAAEVLSRRADLAAPSAPAEVEGLVNYVLQPQMRALNAFRDQEALTALQAEIERLRSLHARDQAHITEQANKLRIAEAERDEARALIRTAYHAGYYQAECGLPDHGDIHQAAIAALAEIVKKAMDAERERCTALAVAAAAHQQEVAKKRDSLGLDWAPNDWAGRELLNLAREIAQIDQRKEKGA